MAYCILLCVIDIFSKHPWVISLKDKNRITITNAFQKVLDKSKAIQIEYESPKAVSFTIDQ